MSDAAPSYVCENCGKRVLPTDTICWHCGQQVTRQATPVTLAPDGQVPEETSRPAYDLRAIAIYGGLTVFLIIALLFVMGALGRRPLLVNSAGLDIGDDWTQLTDSQLRYTLGVPGGWQWLDVPFRDQQAVLAALLERQRYIGRALNPLGEAADDLDIQGVALESQILELPDPVSFVVIGTSSSMRELEPGEAIDLLADSTLPVTDPHIDTSVPLQPRARFSVVDAPYGYQCQHLFVADPETAGYLVGACAPQTDYDTQEQSLNAILNSFQLLEN